MPMKTFAIPEARNEIMKLEPERQALPLRLLDLFDGFFGANDYRGVYRKSNWGGAHYFVYTGYGALNKDYIIEIEFYWDSIKFRISKPPTFRQKVWGGIKLTLFSLFALGYIALIIASIFGESGRGYFGGGSFGSGGSKRSRGKKAPNDFNIASEAKWIVAGARLTGSFTPGEFESVLMSYKSFIEQNLMSTIRGEQWMPWWGKEIQSEPHSAIVSKN